MKLVLYFFSVKEKNCFVFSLVENSEIEVPQLGFLLLILGKQHMFRLDSPIVVSLFTISIRRSNIYILYIVYFTGRKGVVARENMHDQERVNKLDI